MIRFTTVLGIITIGFLVAVFGIMQVHGLNMNDVQKEYNKAQNDFLNNITNSETRDKLNNSIIAPDDPEVSCFAIGWLDKPEASCKILNYTDLYPEENKTK